MLPWRTRQLPEELPKAVADTLGGRRMPFAQRRWGSVQTQNPTPQATARGGGEEVDGTGVLRRAPRKPRQAFLPVQLLTDCWKLGDLMRLVLSGLSILYI